MKTIVTLTTIPSRLTGIYGESGIKGCLNSLQNQTYTNYEVHFNIPHIHKQSGQEYVIPNWLQELDRFKIFRTEDLGPATKLVPTVERIVDSDTTIIVVDDDLIYHEDLVKEQVNNQKKFEESVVGYDGLRSRDNFFKDVRDYFFTSNYRNSRVDILQHYKSVSYKRRYFENDFFDFVKENLTWHDDLLVSAYFSYKKRDRIATFHESDPQLNTLKEWQERGGVTSFPVIRHTSHERDEGCNIYRQAKINDNSTILFKFIDNGY